MKHPTDKELQPTPPYKVIKRLLNGYNSDAINLKHQGLLDLPDGGTCIRASNKVMKNKDLWLEVLDKLELMDKLIVAVDKYKLRYVNKGI